MHDSEDRYWTPGTGTQLQLMRALVVPGGETRVFLQRGEVVARSQLDYYHPSCDLELRALKQHARSIEQDVFIVGRLSSGRESVVQLMQPQLASTRLVGRFFPHGGASVHRFLRIELLSERQPDVMRLTCRGALDDEHAAQLPGRNEIRLALGDILLFL
ncbi:MAG: hypothetical protein KDI68_10680 [Gammaproteobacteria bacterium]|nr:hypothetical protein [Gammaproteobacteria bacterium]